MPPCENTPNKGERLANPSHNGFSYAMVNKALLSKTMQIAALWCGLTGIAFAGELTVAVASNFLTTAQKIAGDFTAQTGHQVHIVNGSTGTLYAQIHNGAPYDVFLSADQERVLLLADAGRLLGGAHKPYALGRLVIYARDADVLQNDIATSLTTKTVHHIAMADPDLAPYGRAAAQVLQHLGLSDAIKPKTVLGTNIGQTFGFVQTGNASVGFVALSQALAMGGTWHEVSPQFYDPIIQEAGLLSHAKENGAAIAFYEHLSSDSATALLTTSGYEVPK